MGEILHLSLDLGKDSLKIAFAYGVNGSGKAKKPSDIRYGKFAIPGYTLKIGFPAVACYNEEANDWVFGDRVDREFNGSFSGVVRIKDLLSLLLYDRCAPYYSGKKHFPRFYFPSSRDYNLIEEFPDSVAFGDTFDGGATPKAVCERYFAYVASVVAERVTTLSKNTGVVFSDIKIALVHPPKVGKKYVEELSYLIKSAFGKAPEKILSTTKSLGMYAKIKGVFKSCSDALIVDMGEEDISVAKVFCDDAVIVDGQEGHSEPLALGASDIDYAIAEMLKKKICKRAPFGRFGEDEQSYEQEEPLYEKQYLFMKNVKSAKVALSKPESDSGAMIGIHYETYKQGTLTREDLEGCIGTSSPYKKPAVGEKTRGVKKTAPDKGAAEDEKIAPRIAKYIINELHMPANNDIITPDGGGCYGRIILSGGLAECYSLKEYVSQAVAVEFPGVTTVAFDENEDSPNEFAVQSYEDSAYAPAVGGALVSLRNEEIVTGLSFSYATWMRCGREFVLSVFVDKGTPIKEGEKFSTTFYFDIPNKTMPSSQHYLATTIEGEAIYSLSITRRELMKFGAPDGRKFKKKYRGEDINCIHFGSEWCLVVEPNANRSISTPEDIDNPRKCRTKKTVRLETKSKGKVELWYAYKSRSGKIEHRRIDRLTRADSEPGLNPLGVVESLTVTDKGTLTVSYELMKNQKSSVYRAHFEGDASYLSSEVSVSQMFVKAQGIEPIIPTISE